MQNTTTTTITDRAVFLGVDELESLDAPDASDFETPAPAASDASAAPSGPGLWDAADKFADANTEGHLAQQQIGSSDSATNAAGWQHAEKAGHDIWTGVVDVCQHFGHCQGS
ncbi:MULTISPECIES: hypothetical protein [unclassified Streptomyces]|uniref:hypothetical protein n=1 Tax=unclassified Streptomyces TaxID=2593676 RepID=UPI0037F87096